ncbi:hypothetical protein BVRB_3g061360 [Beta vulgaris subsp. vulgaris]|nr:hypothetical protein BVRB_3g061360 [Beta vulgaris subsp. vulgaris]
MPHQLFKLQHSQATTSSTGKLQLFVAFVGPTCIEK